MKNTFKRSTAWMLCLALVLGLFAGVPGAVITKANATETEATVEEKNLIAEFNPSFEEYSIPNWTIDDGVVQYRENTAEDDVWSLQINVKDAAATSDAVSVAPYWTYNATVQVKGAGKLAIVFFDAEGAVVGEESAEATAAEWQALNVAAVAPAGAVTAAVKLSATTAAAVYFDDAALTVGAYAASAPTVPNAGLEEWNAAQTRPTNWLVSSSSSGLIATPVAEEVEGRGFVAAYNLEGQGMTLRTEQFAITPGVAYNATMDIMVASGSFRFQFLIRFFDADGNKVDPKAAWSDTYVESTYGVCDWQVMSHAAIAPATAVTAQVWVTAPETWAATASIKLDNVNVSVIDGIYDGSYENPVDNKNAPMGHRFRNGSGAGITTDAAYVKEGEQALNLTGIASHIYSAPTPVVAGQTYKATIYVKSTPEGAAQWAATESTFQYYLRWIDATGENFTSKGNTSMKPTGEWTAIEVEGVAPEGAVAVMTLIANAAALPVYIDCESVVCTSNANLLAGNAGFEDRTTGTRISAADWECTRTDGKDISTIKYDAEKGYVLNVAGIEGPNLNFFGPAVAVEAGQTYTVSVDINAVPETVQWVQVLIRYYNTDTAVSKHISQAMVQVSTPAGGEWISATKSVAAPENATHARVFVAVAGIYSKVDGVTTYGNLADVSFDNFQLYKNCEHDFSAAPVVTPATCVEAGASVITCTCGATSTTVIPATGVHTYESVVTAPTCGAAGYTTNTCTVCGQVTVTDNVPATGEHTADEGVYTAPTTEADGYTTYNCTVCGTTWVETDEGSKLVETVEIIRNGESVGVYYTVAAALAAAQDGDTLSLLADVKEGFNFPGTSGLSNLTLEGNDKTVYGTIRLQTNATDVVSNTTIKNVMFAESAYIVFSVGSYDGVTVSNCSFANGYISTYANNGLKNVTITECIFEDPTNDTNNASAIVVSNAQNLTITNNIILSTQWNAMQIGGASGTVEISGNEITWDVSADVDGAYNIHSAVDAQITIQDNIVTTGEANAENVIVNVQVAATNTAVYLYDDVSINTAYLPDVTEAAGYTIYCTGHNMVDGTCSICGATEAAGNLDENLYFEDKAMLLGGYIGAQLFVNTQLLTDNVYDSVYIVVVMNGQEYTYDVSLDPSCYGFEHRVAPKDMGVTMEMTAYGVKDGVTYHGNTETWSIKEGIMTRLETFIKYIKYDAYKNRCILLVDMLYYGAAAQAALNAENASLVTDGLDAKYVELRTTTAPTIEKTNTATQTGKDQLYQVNLGVEDAVQMQLLFRLSSEDYSKYTVKITNGNDVYEYTGESFVPEGTSSTLKKFVTVVFDKLEATDMRDVVTVELWKDGALVSSSYELSIEGFANAYIQAGSYVDLLTAMITYGDSAIRSLGQ